MEMTMAPISPKNGVSNISPVDIPKFSTKRAVLSDSNFDPRSNVGGLLRYLRAAGATGRLFLDIHKGGVASISFEEKQHVPADVKIVIDSGA